MENLASLIFFVVVGVAIGGPIGGIIGFILALVGIFNEINGKSTENETKNDKPNVEKKTKIANFRNNRPSIKFDIDKEEELSETDPNKLVRIGIEYLEKAEDQSSFNKAFEHFEKAAYLKNYVGLRYLAFCYKHSKGTGEDLRKAFVCYSRAAEGGDTEAIYELGNCFYEGKGTKQDYSEAANLYQKASNRIHAQSRYKLAKCYSQGKGVPKNQEKALYWYNKAASQGLLKAQIDLANCYLTDSGTGKDDSLAFFWFEKAAEKNSPEGQYHLGYCYEYGCGTEKSYRKAISFYRKAAEQGHTRGAESYKRLDVKDRIVATNDCKLNVYDDPNCFKSLSETVLIGSSQSIEQYKESDLAQYIKDFVKTNQIRHLVHFTNCENLKSIFHFGLVSRKNLDVLPTIASVNDTLRLDNCVNSISLSISHPNHLMFYKYRQLNRNSLWAVLLLDPRILWENDCAFCWHNAANSKIRSVSLEERKRYTSLEKMFSNLQDLSARNEQNIPSYFTTDVQAEVLVCNTISVDNISAVVFDNINKQLEFNRRHPKVETILNKQNMGFFGVREYNNGALYLKTSSNEVEDVPF